jgi:hypothetical protein
MTYVTYLILVSSSWLCPGNHLSRNNIQVASVYSLDLPAGSKSRTIPKSGAISPGNQHNHHTPHETPFSVTINTPTQEQTSTITITELTTTTSLYTPNSSSKKAIDNINKNIAEFFNIVIFLMDNLTANDLESINVVIKNYNFYNNNIFTNKDLIKLPLNISCNYYNKYYDMTNRDITNMKNNVSLVSYNFIVLMTALSVVIFEPMLIIKS